MSKRRRWIFKKQKQQAVLQGVKKMCFFHCTATHPSLLDSCKVLNASWVWTVTPIGWPFSERSKASSAGDGEVANIENSGEKHNFSWTPCMLKIFKDYINRTFVWRQCGNIMLSFNKSRYFFRGFLVFFYITNKVILKLVKERF